MENLQIFMDEDTQKEVLDAYVLDGDTYELKDGITGDKREELNDLLCKPLMLYTSFTSGSEESRKMLSQMQVPEGTDSMQVLSAMPEDAKKQMLEAADEKRFRHAGIHSYTGRCQWSESRIRSYGRGSGCNSDELHPDIRNPDGPDGAGDHAGRCKCYLPFSKSGSSPWT